MTRRRRRDGERNPVDGAQAVGPGSTPAPRGPRRDRPVPAPDDQGGDGVPRVHGAWTTPAVVVRAPDGSVVPPGRLGGAAGDRSRAGAADVKARPSSTDVTPQPGAADSTSRADAADVTPRPGSAGAKPRSGAADVKPRPGSTDVTPRPGSADGAATGGRPRVRPRRIPGAPGAVMVSPTLTDGVEAREVRRRRRSEGTASVSPLPPRRPPAGATGDDGDGDEPRARPALRVIPGADGRRRTSAGRGSRGPRPSRPGEPRRQRVVEALAGLNFDRLLPGDDEARARRAAFLRRVAIGLTGVAAVAFAIYAIFPVRTFIDQQSATDRARERLEVFQRENELLEEERRDLRTDERIEQEAREMGFVLPGEELYGVLPAPEAPGSTTTTTTPDG